MQIDPAAVLAVISEQATAISRLEAENAALREAVEKQAPQATPAPPD